ncbi:hypothetical protein Q7P35_001902 [Cladosporium inversicolor]
MHLSTIHGGSYYSGSVNSANTLVRRAEMTSNMWVAVGAGAFVLIALLCIAHGFSQRKFEENMRQKKHAQWYGQQTV